ncbi:MAG TPA: cytochrome c oxidase subunit II [Kiritimatiellia bacterium]|nr:cytochrome c oxidase subunit II [Kiritimatiellia bacterium]HMO97804.1 cytochrome c oxidase subunit II [Kiritimatiellia bacterium]HMP96396.1 cytochrome c oxidase subunit II [Kiritimatiellia bacterium]
MNETFKLLPEQATEYATRVDNLYLFILGVSVFFTVLFIALLVGFTIRYRARKNVSERPEPPHEHYTLEVLGGSFLLVLLMGMFFWGAKLYFQAQRPPADAMEVLVTGKQWMWKIQHPSGKKEINTLHLPVGKPVKLSMTSEDVIHSFFIPAFRVKNDVLPGRYTQLWFHPKKEGTFHLFCAEYCGTEHSRMVGYVKVMSEDEYVRWSAGLGPEGETPVQAGTRLFAELGCLACHNPASGALGPNLAGVFGHEVELADGAKVIADENYLRESILNPQAKVVAGYAPIMPTFQGSVTEEQLGHLIAYIKSLADSGTEL